MNYNKYIYIYNYIVMNNMKYIANNLHNLILVNYK